MTLAVNRITNDTESGPPILQYGFKVESNNSNWVHLKAPDGLAANYTLTLPSHGNEFLVAPTGSVPVLLNADGTIKNTNAPYFCAEHSATETPGASGTFVQWSVQLNTGGATFTSGVYTCAKSGRYLVNISLLRDSSTAAGSGIFINKNNTNLARITFASAQTGYDMASGSYIVDLAVGDTLKLVCEAASVAWYGDANGLGALTIAYLG